MAKSLTHTERYFSVVGYVALLMFWWVALQSVVQSGYNTFYSGTSALFFLVNVTVFGIAAVGSLFYLAGAKKNIAVGIAKAVVLSLAAAVITFLVVWYSGMTVLA